MHFYIHSMPALSRNIESFDFGNTNVRLWVPMLEGLQRSRVVRMGADGATFPYWAKLWPSSIALCRYVAAHPHLVVNKKVLELAAGLGLPGIFAAHLAREVIISDYVPEAVTIMRSSVALNKCDNVHCRTLNWNKLPPDLNAEVLLVSDINYEPLAFEVLYKVLTDFLAKGTTILMATPQRLIAKTFIERLLPHCVAQHEEQVCLLGELTFISIFVLCERPKAL